MTRSFGFVPAKAESSTASIPKQKKEGFWMIRNPFTSKSSIRSPSWSNLSTVASSKGTSLILNAYCAGFLLSLGRLLGRFFRWKGFLSLEGSFPPSLAKSFADSLFP